MLMKKFSKKVSQRSTQAKLKWSPGISPEIGSQIQEPNALHPILESGLAGTGSAACILYLDKNMDASEPSEYPPSKREKYQERLGGNPMLISSTV